MILAAAAFSFMIGSRVGWLRSPQHRQQRRRRHPLRERARVAAPAKAYSSPNKDSSKSKSALIPVELGFRLVHGGITRR